MMCGKIAGRIACLALGLCLVSSLQAESQTEQTFTMLKIGTQTYSNVTVTTKAKNYVMLMHSAGLANIKVSELTPELRAELGYNKSDEQKSKGAKGSMTYAAHWAKTKMGALNISQVQARTFSKYPAGELARVQSLNRKQLYIVAGVALLCYLGFCLCLSQICIKAGKPGGILIWLPVLQAFPLLTAAGMSPLWFFVPGLNGLIWPFKIAKARGKTALTALFLLLPVTNFFALLYLALSDGAPAVKEDSRGSSMMTLESA